VPVAPPPAPTPAALPPVAVADDGQRAAPVWPPPAAGAKVADLFLTMAAFVPSAGLRVGAPQRHRRPLAAPCARRAAAAPRRRRLPVAVADGGPPTRPPAPLQHVAPRWAAAARRAVPPPLRAAAAGVALAALLGAAGAAVVPDARAEGGAVIGQVPTSGLLFKDAIVVHVRWRGEWDALVRVVGRPQPLRGAETMESICCCRRA